MKPRITDDGKAVLIRALHGEGITFTKFKIGNGAKPENYTELTELVNPLASIALTSYTVAQDGFVELTGKFSNAGLTTPFFWTEVGIYVNDPDNDGNDLLYAYGHHQLDEETEVAANIPLPGSELYEIVLTYRVYVGDNEDITAILAESSNYATQEALNSHVNDRNNPHHVTAEDLGISSDFIEKRLDDLQPTVSEAAQNSKPLNGDTLSTIIAKITKAIGSLISHLADTGSHVSAEDRKNWNGKANATHNHSTADITSGILSVARGGTGSGTLYNSDLAKVRNVTLTAAGWSAAAPYTQQVTVTGITANDAPIILPGELSSKTAANYITLGKNFALIDRAVTSANKVTFYCYRQKPANDMPVVIKGV